MKLSRLSAAKWCASMLTSLLFALLMIAGPTPTQARGPESKPTPSGDGDGTPFEEPEATPDGGKGDGPQPPGITHHGEDNPTDVVTVSWLTMQVLRALNLWLLR